MNTIVVLTHSRPECLWLCLASLKRARGIEKYHLLIATNEDCHPEVPDVVKRFCLNGMSRFQMTMRPAGQLIDEANAEAFKQAANLSENFFIEVAEDEEVSSDWLEMLEYCAGHFKRTDTIGVAGAFAINPFRPKSNTDSLIYKSAGFTTQASLIFKEAFNQYVAPYLSEEYYANASGQVGYINHKPNFFKKYFPDQQPVNCGVDGVIIKVMRQNGLHSFIPISPRAHQFGFAGTHMRTNKAIWDSIVTGRIEERAQILRYLIDSGRIGNLFGQWADEYHPIKTDHQWKDLQLNSNQ